MASRRQHERALARRMAVQALYESEMRGQPAAVLIEEGAQLPDEGRLPDFGIELLRRVEEHQDAIDGRISAASQRWSIERMPVVDRAIMRVAVCEMLYEDDVPVSVSINEAVELAKEFGGEDDSPRFANGILGNIARTLEAEGKAAGADRAEGGAA